MRSQKRIICILPTISSKSTVYEEQEGKTINPVMESDFYGVPLGY